MLLSVISIDITSYINNFEFMKQYFMSFIIQHYKAVGSINRHDSFDSGGHRSESTHQKEHIPCPGLAELHRKRVKVNLEDVNFEELAKNTYNFNQAPTKAAILKSGLRT